MNHPLQPLDSLEPEELQHLLDRLVDGELAPPQQQALLRHLDQVEGGWRRCALAFVEAQVWQQELGDWAAEEPSPAPAAAVSTSSDAASSGTTANETAAGSTPGGLAPWQRRTFTVLSMAASFALAFVLGFALHPDQANNAQLAGPAEPAEPAQTNPEAMIAATPAQESLAVDVQGRGTPSPVAPTPSWGHVSLLVNDDGTWQPVDLPAVDGVDAQRWLAAQPSAVPPRWRELMQRQGHTVQTQRELVPVDLGDGRRLVVPVEQVEVQYVGGHRYQ